jgi:hypothetical protein
MGSTSRLDGDKDDKPPDELKTIKIEIYKNKSLIISFNVHNCIFLLL